MFEWIKELVVALRERLQPFEIVYEFESAVVFRFGHYNRTLDTGFHWKWPLIEVVNSEHTAITTLALESQSVTTKDNKIVTVTGIVRYKIADVKLFIIEIADQHDVLRDTSMGAVLKKVRQMTFEDLTETPPEDAIASEIRRQVKPFGIKIELFTFTDIAPMKVLRIVTHTHAPSVFHDF